MQSRHLDIPGLHLITPKRHGDNRGYFAETFKDRWFRENIADVTFVQDNESLSQAVGTVRGLHFQTAPFAQGKLVRVLAGAIFDVAVDIRAGSPTFGKWVGVELSAENGDQLWIPEGFAHGFATLQPDTILNYKVTAPYSRDHDGGTLWNDPAIGIEWPIDVTKVELSEKDKVQPRLADLPTLFPYLP